MRDGYRILVNSVPPLMVKTARNPGGTPIEVFDGFRQALARRPRAVPGDGVFHRPTKHVLIHRPAPLQIRATDVRGDARHRGLRASVKENR